MKNTKLILKSLIIKNFYLLLFLLSSLTGFLSCVSIPNVVIDKAFPRVDTRPPVDAFGLVSVKTTIKPKECLMSENFELCKEMIGKLPDIEQGGIGSGLLVMSKSYPVFLTAAHVCSQESPSFYETEGVKISLEIFTNITIRVSTGEEIIAEIIKIDTALDLCALKPSKMFTQAVQWSSIEPQVGDLVYAISAPYGINYPTMNLIFSGYYSGHSGVFSHYTIPTRPGSSGSVVLDKNFKGVGMLNAAYNTLETIGMGTSYKEIKGFLESI